MSNEEQNNDFLINPEDIDENDSSVGFIKPNIEAQLSVKKRQACRDIVQEIRKFGISQRQLVYLIYLLSLDLENNELMRGITALVGEQRDNVPLTKNDLPENKQVSRILLTDDDEWVVLSSSTIS